MPRPTKNAEPIRAEDHLNLARWQTVKALRWQHRSLHGLEDTDIYGDALLGLAKAIERFDPTLGWQFSTFAVTCIWNEIRRGLVERGEKFDAKRLNRWRGKEMLFSELSREDAEGGQDLLFDRILAAPEDADQTEVEHHFDRLWRLLEHVRGVSKDRDRRILFKRAMGMGLREVGREEVPPLTRERIRQIEQQALERLRRELKRKGITRNGDVTKNGHGHQFA